MHPYSTWIHLYSLNICTVTCTITCSLPAPIPYSTDWMTMNSPWGSIYVAHGCQTIPTPRWSYELMHLMGWLRGNLYRHDRTAIPYSAVLISQKKGSIWRKMHFDEKKAFLSEKVCYTEGAVPVLWQSKRYRLRLRMSTASISTATRRPSALSIGLADIWQRLGSRFGDKSRMIDDVVSGT